jgi:hypothetical protein
MCPAGTLLWEAIMKVLSLTPLLVAGISLSLPGQNVSHGSLAMDPVANLHRDMRKLWTDHVVWTRQYIVSALGDQPDQQAAANRLMKNQEDIGGAVAHFYGKAAGDQTTTLLKEHITIAVDLIKAAKAGDKAGQDAADRKWHDNATAIADFLSKANPNWPRATLVEMMNEHLETTTKEVVARLQKNWDEDVKAYDAVYAHILEMSDALADGIAKQFPDKVK